MDFYLIFGAIFLLLIVGCWIVFRQTRTATVRNNISLKRVAPEIDMTDTSTEQYRYADGIQLGPVRQAHSDDATPPRRAENLNGDSESADYWEWHDDDAAHEEYEPQQLSTDEDLDDSISAETDDWEPLDEEFVLPDIEPQPEEESEQHAVLAEEQLEPVIDEDRMHEISEDAGWRDIEEPMIVEPNIGIQTNLPLRTAEVNGRDDDGSLTLIEQIDVDESITFPEIHASGSQIVDMVCWLPGNDTTVARIELLALIRDFGENIEMPVSMYGQLADSDSWANLQDEHVSARFGDLILTMQLTHAGKSVDERSWWRFYNMGEQIAKSLSRPFYPSLSLDSALSVSRTLTEQVDNLNIQAVLILLSANNRRLSDRMLEYVAREYQLVGRADGRVYEKINLLSQNRAPLFSITKTLPPNQDEEDDSEEFGLALYCNLPCVQDPLDAFDQMVELARDFENRFSLRLVDEDRNRVSAAEIGVIRSHIRNFADDMEYCGIIPGSEAAMRLFHSLPFDEEGTGVSEMPHLSRER